MTYPPLHHPSGEHPPNRTPAPPHAYLVPDDPSDNGDHLWHGYPDECFAMTSFTDSLVAQVLYGAWATQPPITAVKMALAIDFVSHRQAEAEASLGRGWNGAWEFPMGIANTVNSRTVINEQNARIGRHLTLIGTAMTGNDFHTRVIDRLLDVHSCPDRKHCEICQKRESRGLADVFELLAAGTSLSEVHLFSHWRPDDQLVALLKADGVSIIHHELTDIPEADREANRYYTIWDGTEAQGHDFRDAVWSPSWKRR